MARGKIESWLYPAPAGLYCAPGDFYIDPSRTVDRAIISHGHSDHARPGHAAVLTTPETAAIMRARYGAGCAGRFDEASYGTTRSVNGVGITLAPAGHILGSAQVALDWQGQRAVISGDYKRATDPTCTPFELVPCDVFVTEATFGLPVFRHENASAEIRRLLHSLDAEHERTHLVGAYGLGKCQRVIRLLRDEGYDAPIYLHGAMAELCALYVSLGIDLGELRLVSESNTGDLGGAIVLCPPSALSDRWTRRFADPVACFASGWMRVRGRARQRGVELPLVISDHADWPELIDTAIATGASEIWITHGREDALVHHFGSLGLKARALSLVGRDEEGE